MNCRMCKKHMSVQDLELVILIRVAIFKIKEPLDLTGNTVCYVMS